MRLSERRIQFKRFGRMLSRGGKRVVGSDIAQIPQCRIGIRQPRISGCKRGININGALEALDGPP